MNKQTLTKLREEYPRSSWALWSSAYPADGCPEHQAEAGNDSSALVSLIYDNCHRLQPEVVFLSLNPASNLPTGFSNFHSTNKNHGDYKLRDAVEATRLEGGYMTDLVSDEVDSNSNNIDPNSDNVEELLEQLRLLDQPKYHVICFLDQTYRSLKQHFKSRLIERDTDQVLEAFETSWEDRVLCVYRVYFFNQWGANKSKQAEMEQQLEYLGGKIEI